MSRASLIVGDSTEMQRVLDAVEEVAETDAPVLLQGEPGTGRELVARAIHYGSARRRRNFISMKAATIPRSRIGDELYGQSSGTLQRAQGGTLLVKDVAALPREPQRRLARFLARREQKKDEGTGETFDVRILAASEADLEPAVVAEAFDRELYSRLARKIEIPPLRRRLDDLPRLTDQFLRKTCAEIGKRPMRLAESALERLARYPWPGNVAELKDIARRLVYTAKRSKIEAADVERVLPKVAERIPMEEMPFEELVAVKLRHFLQRVDGYEVENLYDDVIARVERPLLQLVLEHSGGNQLKAARILGLNRNTLRKKLQQNGLLQNGHRK